MRALLIQKSIKQTLLEKDAEISLRALLIQKSIKLYEPTSLPLPSFESFVNSEEYQTIVLTI